MRNRSRRKRSISGTKGATVAASRGARQQQQQQHESLADEQLRRDDHPQALAQVLAMAGDTARFADVKMVCGGGPNGANDPDRVLWSHSFLLAATSPFMAALLADGGAEADHAVHLPDVRPAHLRMVLDYLYTGAMYLTAADLAPVLGVIEMLRMTCGVSVSKMVKKTEARATKASSRRRRVTKKENERESWVEEAKFGGGLDQIKRELTEGEEEEGMEQDNSNMGMMTEQHDEQDLPPLSSPLTQQEVQQQPDLQQPQEAIPKNQAESSNEMEVDSETRTKTPTNFHAEHESGAFEVVAGSSDEEEEDEEAVEVHPDDLAEGSSEGGAPDAVKESHSCVMCGKTFLHADNLKAHLQNHLGVKAQLSSCVACKRIFRSSLELDLHETSHKFAKFQRKRLSKDELSSAEIARRHLVKQAIRHFVKKWEWARREEKRKEEERKRREEAKLAKAKAQLGKKKLTVSLEKVKMAEETCKSASSVSTPLTLKVKFPLAAVQKQKQKQKLLSRKNKVGNYCDTCEKSFSTPGSLRRHINNFHSGVVVVGKHRDGSGVETEEDSEYEHRRPKFNAKKVPNSPVRKRKRGRPSQSSESDSPMRPKSESDLTCPKCDRTFPAKSVYERHLKTAHQGILAAEAPSTPITPTPHMNRVLQPTMEVGGVTVNKYECHLCNKVFLRVKDLAKHRDKACTAWM